MLEKVFDSGDVPAPDRVEAFRDVTARTLVPTEISGETPPGLRPASAFRAVLQAADLGGVTVAAPVLAALRSHRTPRLVRQSDPEMYVVALTLSGRTHMAMERRAAALRAGDFVVFSTSRPYQGAVDARWGASASVVVQVPRTLVAVPPDRVERIQAARIPGRDGVGGLLAGFLARMAADTAPSRAADDRRLGGVLAELVTAWLAHHCDCEDQTPAESRGHLQFLQITSFIRRHLGDTALSPGAVAAAHHVSLRTLHRLFHDHGQGETPASYIRRRRLAHARHDLADPYLAARPVQAIAARWGFPRPPDFTRAFRAAYGTTPTQYRQERLRTHRGTQP